MELYLCLYSATPPMLQSTFSRLAGSNYFQFLINYSIMKMKLFLITDMVVGQLFVKLTIVLYTNYTIMAYFLLWQHLAG